MKVHGKARRRPWLVSMAILIGAGIVASGCSTVGGGESGNKHGPYTDNPRAKPGKGKFKSYCNTMAEPDGGVMVASNSEAFDVMLGYSGPGSLEGARIAIGPDPSLLLAWGSSGGGGGGHTRPDC
jgi:hypothetical protein